jgi:hypothetical protein
MSRQESRQLAAARKIAEMAAKVSNEDIQSEVDSLFASITSACILIEQEIQKRGRP